MRKVILKRKSDQKSRSENNRGKSDEKEKRRMEFFLNGMDFEVRRTSGDARLRRIGGGGGGGGGGWRLAAAAAGG